MHNLLDIKTELVNDLTPMLAPSLSVEVLSQVDEAFYAVAKQLKDFIDGIEDPAAKETPGVSVTAEGQIVPDNLEGYGHFEMTESADSDVNSFSTGVEENAAAVNAAADAENALESLGV